MIRKGSRVRVKDCANSVFLEYLKGCSGTVVKVYTAAPDIVVDFGHGVTEIFLMDELEVVDPCEEVKSENSNASSS